MILLISYLKYFGFIGGYLSFNPSLSTNINFASSTNSPAYIFAIAAKTIKT